MIYGIDPPKEKNMDSLVESFEKDIEIFGLWKQNHFLDAMISLERYICQHVEARFSS